MPHPEDGFYKNLLAALNTKTKCGRVYPPGLEVVPFVKSSCEEHLPV
jgi:hypothetical protein